MRGASLTGATFSTMVWSASLDTVAGPKGDRCLTVHVVVNGAVEKITLETDVENLRVGVADDGQGEAFDSTVAPCSSVSNTYGNRARLP